MADRKLEGLVRLIDKRKAGDRHTTETMVELGEASEVSGADGAVPTCTVDGDDAEVFEPYGLAGHAASGDALVFAPGGDSDSLTALVSSVAGRPATEPGDKALWTVGGHVVYLDDDGGITITARSLADVTIIVDDGQVVNVGDALAAALLKAKLTQNHLVQAAAYATLPGNFAPNDGGVLSFTNFGAYLAGTAIAPPAVPGNDLVNAAATAKARGS